jgi:hypothetical protein
VKRLGLAFLAFLVLVPLATAAQPQRAHLRAFVCQKAVDPAMRAVSVEAVMRHIPGTAAMALRFQLYQKPATASATAGAFSALQVGDLGTWISPSTPKLGSLAGDVWVLDHPVANLPAPATYYYVVTFRWTGAHGKLLATDMRRSIPCYQPELRPDLAVTEVDIGPDPAHPKLDDYTATIANLGLTAAGPFDVQFSSPDGSAPKTHTVVKLGPKSRRQEVFVGRACTAQNAPTVTVDPTHQITDDLNPANEILTVPTACPPATTAT